MLPYGRSFSIVRDFSTPLFLPRLYASILSLVIRKHPPSLVMQQYPASRYTPSSSFFSRLLSPPIRLLMLTIPLAQNPLKFGARSPSFFSPTATIPSTQFLCHAPRSRSLFTLITVFSIPSTSFRPHYRLFCLHYRLFRLHYCLFHPYGHYPFPSEIARISGFRSLSDPIIKLRPIRFHLMNIFI
ncbi:hypothetical protein B0G52_104198 [Cohnella sp. SGD-V74]|nr:hypothetical protein B0G52_104198 [Cohnella sp. SGD-V74]